MCRPIEVLTTAFSHITPPPLLTHPTTHHTNTTQNSADVQALQAENRGLKQALAQAQEAVAAYDRDNKILKRGVAVQSGKIERCEAELESLRGGNRQAMEHIGRLEQVGLWVISGCVVVFFWLWWVGWGGNRGWGGVGLIGLLLRRLYVYLCG